MTEEAKPADEPKGFDPGMTNALFSVPAAALALVIVAMIGWGWLVALSVAVGGLLASMNLWVFALVGRGILSGGAKRRFWALVGTLKFLALVGLLYWVVKQPMTRALPLVLGYGSLPLGLTVASFLGVGDDDA